MAEPTNLLPPGYRLAFFEQIDSTNSEALRQAGKGEEHGLWVWTLSQQAGRGRHGRHWDSLAGNLFASLLLRPECSPMIASQLGFVGGLALFDTIHNLAHEDRVLPLTIKWPNDLLCEGMKVGGILLESTSDINGATSVVMGMGVNLSEHPQGTEYPATDLGQYDIVTTPAKVLEHLAQACDIWLGVWNNGAGFEAIREAWMERSLPINAPLKVRLSDEILQGFYQGIDPDGALILAIADGQERRIRTGDIFPL
jgi:BirA family biotin operon repressor/biotin-[acetyl-CoA-carboxylase] ligase